MRRPPLLFLAVALSMFVDRPNGRLDAAGPPRTDDFRQQLVGFDEVLEQIRLASDGEVWKKSNWKPPVVEGWLDRLTTEVKRAAKSETLKLPVKFADVKAGDAAAVNAMNSSVLHVVKDGKFSFLRSCVVLADGSVEVTSAENCIIIARCGVRVSSSRNNYILAGYCIDVSHDMVVARPNNEATDGSLLMSRAIIRCSYGNGSICSAPDLVDLQQATNVTFLNSPKRQVGNEQECKQVTDDLIPFRCRTIKNPLLERVKITQIVPGDIGAATVGGLVVHERNGVEFVVRPGSAVHDESGKPLAGLENWKLSFLGRDLAVFSDGRQDAGFMVKR